MTSDAVLGRFDLDAEIARFQPGDSSAGRRAETLLKHGQLRVVLITMRAGAELAEHTAPGPITIQPLRGRFQVTTSVDAHELAPLQLIAIETGARHAVRALEDGAFLLTIGWTAGGTPPPMLQE